MEETQWKNQELRKQVEESLQQKNQLAEEVEAMRGRVESLTVSNQKLAAEVRSLRQSLQVRRSPPPPPSPGGKKIREMLVHMPPP